MFCSVVFNTMENLSIECLEYFIQDSEEELTSMNINHSKFKLKSDQCGRLELGMSDLTSGF